MIKVPELILLILLITEMSYAGLFFSGRLEKRPLESAQSTYHAPFVSTPVRNNPEEKQNNPVETQVLARCIFSASRTYNLPADALIGIMSIEGGHVGQKVGPNLNGTYDLGPMQINSIWVPQLAQLWHVSSGTAQAWVRDNGCENVYVGAWILKQKIVETGNLYNGIAFYHSARRGLGTAYANKVVSAIDGNNRSYRKY